MTKDALTPFFVYLSAFYLREKVHLLGLDTTINGFTAYQIDFVDFLEVIVKKICEIF